MSFHTYSCRVRASFELEIKDVVHPKLHNINLCNITHSLIYRNSKERMFLVHNLAPYCHISLPYITRFAINANHRRNQPTPSYCVICQYMECFLLILILNFIMSLVELLVHGFVTLFGKAKGEVDMRRWIMCCDIVDFPWYCLF